MLFDGLRWVRFWWRQSDDFDKIVEHLHARGLANLIRVVVGLHAATLAALVLLSLWAGTGPSGRVQIACLAASFCGGLGCAALWATRWPNRVQSIAFAIGATAAIALAALSQRDPTAALVACTTFATIAAYIAAFHTPPLIVLEFAIAASTSAYESSRMTSLSVTARAITFVIIVLLISAVPLAIQVLVRTLGIDAIQSERDSLTGLLNRSGFYRHAQARMRLESGHVDVAVAVIDLDRFKQLNDSYGHLCGDRALAAVAAALNTTSARTAVIGRVGGEEFAVANLLSANAIEIEAQRMRQAIADLPFNLTASIGTASTRIRCGADDLAKRFTGLFDQADAAMYSAKRLGGNKVRPFDPSLVSPAPSLDSGPTDAVSVET